MADVVFHSSGSTGAAKEIVRSEASLQEDARRLIESFPDVWNSSSASGDTPLAPSGDRPLVPSGDRPLVIASVLPEHMYGALWRVRAPALAGIPVEPETIVSVEQLTSLSKGVCPHLSLSSGVCPQKLIFVTTPSFLEKALDNPDFSKLNGSFRAIVTSGSPLRRETALAVQSSVGVCPLEIYGSTEAGTIAWRRQCDGEAYTLVSGVNAAIKAMGTDPGEDQLMGTDPDKALGTDSLEGLLVVDSPFAMERPLAMGDFAERIDERHFRLKGRADRRVKILERYVSLSAVETALAAHPSVRGVRVEAYGESVPRLGALIVLTEEGRARVLRESAEAVTSELRRFLQGRIDGLAVPRRFRFVRELPVNAQGKTTAAAARIALSAWCREPVVTSWRAMMDELEAGLVFTPNLECFEGHFPEFPILPGVAQLYFIRHFARQVFPDWPEAATFRKLKFQKVIRPGIPVTMKVFRRGEGAFAFELAIASGRSTSGTVEVTTANS